MNAWHGTRHLRPLAVQAAAAVSLLTALVPYPRDSIRPLAAPWISVDPASGPAGRTVQLSGAGWTAAPYAAPYEIHWENMGGKKLGSFAPNANGGFSVEITIPASASEGDHKIYACQDCNGKATWASTIYDVEVTATWTPTPTSTLRPPTPTPTPTRVPTECDRSGLAGEYVIDFEGLAAGSALNDTVLPPGVRFLGEDSLRVFRPAVHTRSGSMALMNDFAGREFGSINIPIRIGLENLADFVGVFVGLNEQIWATEPFTVTLTAFALNEWGRREIAGTDSETLGPGPEPIEICLAVAAPGIFEVTISYDGPAGVAEPEVIDDLVLRGPESPVPVPEDDRAPYVIIDHPELASTLSGESARVDGTVDEDRELERIEIWLNGALYRGIGFTPAGEGKYAYFLDGIPASDLPGCYSQEVEVRAYDRAGNRGDRRVNFRFRNGDLAIVDAEPVQVLYDAPLIVGKGTAFRVKVDSTFACSVEAAFRLVLPAGQWDTGAPVSEASGAPPLPGYHMPDVSGPVHIPTHADDFEVMLPYVGWSSLDLEAEWDPVDDPFGLAGLVRGVPQPAAAEVTFSVQLDPENELNEADETNNTLESGRYETVTTKGIHIVFIGQVWDHDRFIKAMAEQLARGEVDELRFRHESEFIAHLPEYAAQQMDYLIGTYPVADAKVSWQAVDTMYFRENYRESYEADPNCWDAAENKEKGCNACFSNMMSSMIQADESTSDAHAVALVQPYGCCGCNGSGIAVYLEDDGVIDGTLVHELGHQDNGSWDCYACRHTDGSCGCTRCGDVACESCAASEGFWVNHWQAYDATAMYYMDCVSNPGAIWSKIGSCATTGGVEGSTDYLDLIEVLRDAADPPAVVVRGTLTKEDEATFAPFLRVDQAVVDLQPDSAGTHAIVFVDAGGRVLARHGFTPVFTRYMPEPEGTVEIDTYYFSFRVAWKDGIAAIELRDAAGKVLASRPVSANAPAVELQAPNGGEQWRQGSRQAIRWEGSDPDGDDLSYALWISDDGGESWQPLAIDIADSSTTVDTTGFPIGDAFRIKVRVTDGVNTGMDESDASFLVFEATGGPGPTLLLAGAALAAVIGVTLVGLGLRPRKPRAPAG